MTNNYDDKNKKADEVKERERLIKKLSELRGDKLRMVVGFVMGLEEGGK